MRQSLLGLLGVALLVVGCAAGTEATGGDAGGGGGDDDAGRIVLEDSGSNDLADGSDPTTPKLGEDSGSTTPPEDAGHHDSGTTPPADSGHAEDTGSTGHDSGGSGETVCKGYAPPDVKETACKGSCSKPPCQANGCYNGYWCELSSGYCDKYPPSGCKD